MEALGSATAASGQVQKPAQQPTPAATQQTAERRQQQAEAASTARQAEQERSQARETTNAQGERIGRIINETA